jgi:hypothetical protein
VEEKSREREREYTRETEYYDQAPLATNYKNKNKEVCNQLHGWLSPHKEPTKSSLKLL